MKTALVAALLAVAATAAADPVKVAAHAVDFTRPAKWSVVTEEPRKGGLLATYSIDKQSVTLMFRPHSVDGGPVDLDKGLKFVGTLMDSRDMVPDGKPTTIAANGFAATSQRYVKKDKSAWAIGGNVDLGPLELQFTAEAPAKSDDITKTTADILASVTVDGKKGPAVYPKKK